MLAATLARLLLGLIDVVTVPFRLLLALLPGHRFRVGWLSRRVPPAQSPEGA
jgi:hypothetical protein